MTVFMAGFVPLWDYTHFCAIAKMRLADLKA